MKTYKSAIIGCGRIGCFLDSDPKRKGVIWTHAGAYRACRRTELVGLVDINKEARLAAARRWGISRTYATLDDLMQESAIDLLSICTPSSSHAELFQKARSYRIPAIWCEKPMAGSVKEADAMVKAAKGLVVAVNHTRRWDKAYEIARQTIRRGGIGRPLAATAWYTNGVGNIGSHLFDIVRYLLGEPSGVQSTPPDGTSDPTLSGTIHFPGGLICHVVGCQPGHVFLFEIDILGTQGRLRVSDDGKAVDLSPIQNSRRYTGYREIFKRKSLWKGQDGRRMVTAVEDLVRGLDRKTSTRCTVTDGLKAVEMIAAFMLSAKSGRFVDLPLRGADRGSRIPIR